LPDLRAQMAGIASPNPFWLASAPSTNTGDQIMRAFDLGWGGAVWKTLCDPIQNTSGRLGALHHDGARMVGFSNIELISDRPLETNLRELAAVKRRYPGHAVVASLMFGTREAWVDAVRRCVDAGADGLELNFGCPHGMCERGMGSAVGQEPQVNETITRWVTEVSPIPVLVKLTPNVTDILPHGLASQRGGAHGVSLINTVRSVIGVDIDRFVPLPSVGDQGTHGGLSGPAIRPIALAMVGTLARSRQFHLPISAIGGISEWRHAVEFMLLGASTVQVATAVMHRGYRIVEDLIEGLEDWMDDHGFARLSDFIGKAVPRFVDWGALDLNYESVARIDRDRCIGCRCCVVACRDGGHQCIHVDPGSSAPRVDEDACVGCNLCSHVCPVEGCISMIRVDNALPSVSWDEHVADGTPIRPRKGVRS
jgi:dihydropyrimidine dehydrogenase (NAD+) subunit PreA